MTTSLKLDEIIVIIIIVLLIGWLVYNRWLSGGKPGAEEHQLNINSLITKVRDELVAADLQRRKANEASLFQIEEFVLELNFVVKSSTASNAGLKTELVAVGTEHQYAQEQVQKITLKMTLPEAKRDTLARGIVERKKPS